MPKLCGYALQIRGKAAFYDELKGEWDMHIADDFVMSLDDFNGLMNHGGYGLGQRNLR